MNNEKQKTKQPHLFQKGDRVRSIYTGEDFTVIRSYWQGYEGPGTGDYTVEFEPTDEQPTPWDKSMNLELITDKNIGE